MSRGRRLYSDLGIILMAEIIRLTETGRLANENIFGPLGMEHSMYGRRRHQPVPTGLTASCAGWCGAKCTATRLRSAAFGARRGFQHGAGSGGLLPNVVEWRRVRTPADSDGLPSRNLPCRNRWRKIPARWAGWCRRKAAQASTIFFAQLRAYGLYRNRHGLIGPAAFVVLLTNRVHPTRENHKIAEVRPAVHDAVMKALGLAVEAAPAK